MFKYFRHYLYSPSTDAWRVLQWLYQRERAHANVGISIAHAEEFSDIDVIEVGRELQRRGWINKGASWELTKHGRRVLGI